MNSSRGSEGLDYQTLALLLERLRKSLAHDLRTPLSTIVNYAAVLESSPGASADEVGDLARRIRGNAARAVRMMEMIAAALALAGRSPRPSSTDVAALARSVLVDAQGRGDVRVVGGNSIAVVDAEILGFAWRAFVSVERGATAKSVDAADVEVRSAGREVILELHGENPRRAEGPARQRAPAGITEYLRHDGGPARLESSLGLGLALALAESHGAELAAWGRPGSASGIELRLPSG